MNRPAQSVLAIFANPVGSSVLRLGEEDRVIRECIQLSQHRNIHLEVRHAATIHDARRALLNGSWSVVHFSGHGSGKGLVLEDEVGRPQAVPANALAELLGAYSPPIHTVLLNACYSAVHRPALSQLRVPYVILSEQAIADRSALEFTRGFYDALAAGRDTVFAYEEGCRAVKLLGRTQDLPTLTQTNPQSGAGARSRPTAAPRNAAAEWAVKCRLCKGTGFVGLFNRHSCTTCAGRGQLILAGSVADYTRCALCNGSGISSVLDLLDRTACTSCSGTGFERVLERMV